MFTSGGLGYEKAGALAAWNASGHLMAIMLSSDRGGKVSIESMNFSSLVTVRLPESISIASCFSLICF